MEDGQNIVPGTTVLCHVMVERHVDLEHVITLRPQLEERIAVVTYKNARTVTQSVAKVNKIINANIMPVDFNETVNPLLLL